MKCIVLSEPGEALQSAELPDPEPGPDELLVNVEACGVCHSDLHLADGDWNEIFDRRVRPTILGHEIVGTVIARGASVRTIEKGQRIGVGWVGQSCGSCDACRAGNDNLCDARRLTCIDRQGGWSSLATIHVSQAVAVPDGLDPIEVAPLFCAGVTVHRAMKKAAIKPGERVAVFGIGGLGHIAVQLARNLRAETIAVDPEPSKLELANKLGASLSVPVEQAVGAIRERGGAHVAIVTAASVNAYEDALHSLRKGGVLIVVGLPNKLLRWRADEIATNEIRILGSAVGSRADIEELLKLAANGLVRCVTERLGLEDANEALTRLRRGDVTGRLVLAP